MLTGISIGSNLGIRENLLNGAIAYIRKVGTEVRVASFIETEPVACPPGSPLFLNTALVFNYSGDLIELLDYCQALEQAVGREAEWTRDRNAPRPLDLDLLFCDQFQIQTPRLTLPHPRMMERRFVLEPLAELVPNFCPFPGGPTVLEQFRKLS